MPSRKTLVLGASDNPARYSYLAVQQLKKHGHPILAIGKRPSAVAGVEITTEKIQAEDIDTITVYLNPDNQKEYYSYIISLKPRRIIFNPGAENPELAELAQKNNVTPVNACTLVLLSTGQY